MHELFEKSLKKVYMNVNRIIIDLSAIIPESHFEPGKNKKFVFSALEKKGRSENYLPAIQWLCENHAQAKLLNTKPTENTPNACRLIGAQLFKMLINLRNDTASGAAQPHTESAPPYGRTY